MACDAWAGKLEVYLDGELAPDETRALNEHLRICAACSSEGLRLLQWKRGIQTSGRRFVPDPAFRRRIQDAVSERKQRPTAWRWLPAAAAAMALLLIALGTVLTRRVDSRDQMFSQIADLHVATLASSNPIDVASEDRHTVKPWFAGRIPFTFDLPELTHTPFTLLGGRVSYLQQVPGTELLFQVRKHKISVFIFPERNLPVRGTDENRVLTRHSFNVQTWAQGGLRYFVIGDVASEDIASLSSLMRNAAAR